VTRRAALAAALVVPACEAGEAVHDVEILRDPIAAVDLDPDPDVVEISLVAEVATVELVPGIATEVWAYRDAGAPDTVATIPGPHIEAAVGDRLVVHLQNDLPQGTTLHWHGLRLPETMDGNPMVSGTIASGASTTVDIVLRDVGLHWYHPHVYADEQIQRGLQGTILVRGPDEPAADRERVLVLDDVELQEDGTLVMGPTTDDVMYGRRGNALLVNGRTPAMATATDGTVERWRLVNTSNGRFFALALGGVGLRVIGWDGALVQPYDVEQLVIAPGERYDVLVPIAGEVGEEIVLATLPVARGAGGDDGGPYTLLRLAIEDSRGRDPVVVDPQAPVLEALPVDEGTAVRRFELDHQAGMGVGAVFTVNGQRWPLNTPVHVDFGATEIWEIVNLGDHEHPFHLHGMSFQILDRDGVGEPTLGWKDTVRVGPRGTTRIAVRYDELGMWMFHCTIPEHAERGMMGDLHVMEAP